MSVVIKDVESGSLASKKGIKKGDVLLTLNDHNIVDVLDFRFYQNNSIVVAEILNQKGKTKKYKFRKKEDEEIGLLFDTYLMDEKRSCKNKCVFCFIDQLPKGLRDSLYFKDDDSRLSFLFGNYITLTNITEHEINRIINMHISPINISVHTTNPELRVKMMKNKYAGDALKYLNDFENAGIDMNSQLVLCPGYNDGEELKKSLNDLCALSHMKCIAAVPVGLTQFRDGLEQLKPFDKQTAAEVIDIIDEFGDACIEKYGERRVYAADEFYILAERKIPDAEYYGDFLQLENGVGLCSLFKDEAMTALDEIDDVNGKRHVSVVTGVAAYPLICEVVDICKTKCNGLNCDVFAIENKFFGERITVSGLITATDIINSLSGVDLGQDLLIPDSMLRSEGDMFLDSVTVEELSQKLNVNIIVVKNSGESFINAVLGIGEV